MHSSNSRSVASSAACGASASGEAAKEQHQHRREDRPLRIVHRRKAGGGGDRVGKVAFATEAETADLARAYAEGIAWGEAKERLFERLDREIAPMRLVYDELMKDPGRIETVLKAGAAKARATATPFTGRLRQAVGLRPLDQAVETRRGKGQKAAGPVFKQYRETDGRFHFKLTDARGTVLLQSQGFEAPREAAQAMARIQQEGLSAVAALHDRLEPAADPQALAAALAALAASAG